MSSSYEPLWSRVDEHNAPNPSPVCGSHGNRALPADGSGASGLNERHLGLLRSHAG